MSRAANILTTLSVAVLCSPDVARHRSGAHSNTCPTWLAIPLTKLTLQIPLRGMDSRSSRPVAGTIPRGSHPFHYGPGEDEAVRAGRELENPYHASPQTLEEGKALFQTYCAVCHGTQGKGDGPISGKIPASAFVSVGAADAISSRADLPRDYPRDRQDALLCQPAQR